MRVSSLINNMTHIYEQSSDPNESQVYPRCKPNTKVDPNNTKVLGKKEFNKYVKDGKICPKCLRYKKNIVV
jgi:hypothetical protein